MDEECIEDSQFFKDSIVKLLSSVLLQKNVKSYHVQRIDAKKFKITIKLEKFLDSIKCYSEFTFYPEQCTVYAQTFFVDKKNQILAIKKTKSIRLLLARYFSRLNSLFRVGQFVIDPFGGQIVLKMNRVLMTTTINHKISSLIKNISNETQNQVQKLIDSLFRSINLTTHYSLSFHIYKLLYQMNLLKYSDFFELDKVIGKNYRRINQDVEKILQKISDLLQKSHLIDMGKKVEKDYPEMFKVPKQTPIVGMDAKVGSPIDLVTEYSDFLKMIKNPENMIAEGGFGKIYRCQLEYQYKDGIKTKTEKRFFTVKVEKEFQSKIQNEKFIIKHLSQQSSNSEEIKGNVENQSLEDSQSRQIQNNIKNMKIEVDQKTDQQKGITTQGQLNIGESPFIAKFYLPQNPDYNKILLMESYHHSSLDSFLQRFSNTMYLGTKIYLLYQIAMGLKFLSDNKVCHNDIKPANILITKGYIAKITDFGEAQLISQNYNSGITMPYTSPDTLKKQFNPKLDIFSFGIMAFEILFDSYPVNYKNNEKQLEKSYEMRKIIFKVNENDLIKQGPKELMEVLLKLIKKCLNEYPEHRPEYSCIIVILRQCLQFLDRIF